VAEIEAAFLFADLCGYTALTEAMGDLDAADVAARFYGLARTSLVGDARMVKTIGDAVMVVASEPSTAVSSVLWLVASMAKEPGMPQLRAGLHFGRAVERDGDYFGASVNLAARVAGHARGGQILCTDTITSALRQGGLTALRPLGTVSFKNVAEAVFLHELTNAAELSVFRDLDPVCRMRVDPLRAAAQVEHEGFAYSFCSAACAQKFSQAPGSYVVK